MSTQTYATHRHNPKLTGIGFLLLVAAGLLFALRWFHVGGSEMFAAGLVALMGSVLVLLTISRVYTTKLQDRIIMLEMRLRCGQLLTAAQLATLARLSSPQVIALRFASDSELPALLERADRDRLTADQIKKAITTWVPDLNRT
ncbi:MAG: DUF6526 family protein [Acidobacteriota bacterium]